MAAPILFPASELAVQMALHLCALALGRVLPRTDGNPLHMHECMLDSEDQGGRVLTAMGLLRPGDGGQRHALTLPQASLAGRLRARRDLAQHLPELERALFKTFGLQGAAYPVTRAPFDAPDAPGGLTRALINAGYLEHHGDRLRWTDVAAPAMERAGHWRDGRSIRDEVIAARDARGQEVWQAMPLLLKLRLRRAADRMQGLALMRLVARHYHGGRWHHVALPDTGAVRMADLDLDALRHIVERLRERPAQRT